MTQRVPIPEEIVGLIKAIVNQDRRERQAAGYKLGTIGLAKRIATELGVSLEAVRKIKERKRRKHVPASRLLWNSVTMEPEQLEQIRQRRIRWGRVGASWRGWRPDLYCGHWSFRKRLDEPAAASKRPDKRYRHRRRSRSPKRP